MAGVCIFTSEENTLKAYKLTGYNLHNCIRMVQNEMETNYLRIIKNFEGIKNISLLAYDHYYRTMNNCARITCLISNLFQSMIHYEKLQEDVATNLTLVNNLSTRYVFHHIAMDCASNSLARITENYKIGKNLVERCVFESYETSPGNSTESRNQ